MANNWKEIWSKKSTAHNLEELDEYELFCELKRIDGFDVGVENAEGYYQYFYNQVANMIMTIHELINGDALHSAFEVGCGSGVNLWLLKKRLGLEPGGIDYSASLASIANKMLRGDVIQCKAAVEMDISPQYDLVFSNSVFQYFSDEAYAEIVLELMLQKSKKIVALLEIHDADYKEEWLADRRSKIPDYDVRYKDLGSLFLSKQWVEDIAARHDKKVHFTYAESPYYVSSKYIYDAYIY